MVAAVSFPKTDAGNCAERTIITDSKYLAMLQLVRTLLQGVETFDKQFECEGLSHGNKPHRLELACHTIDTVRQPQVEAGFSGGTITSNAGTLLAALGEQRPENCSTGSEIASVTPGSQDLVVHSCRSLAGQRVLGLLFGGEHPQRPRGAAKVAGVRRRLRMHRGRRRD